MSGGSNFLPRIFKPSPPREEDVEMLVAMGISGDRARWALRREAGDLSAAVDLATSPWAEQLMQKEELMEAGGQEGCEVNDASHPDDEPHATGPKGGKGAKGGPAAKLAKGVGKALGFLAGAVGKGIAKGLGKVMDVHGHHVPWLQLPFMHPEELWSKWVSKERGVGAALPEYETAAGLICVADHLMCSSLRGRRLAYLDQTMQAPGVLEIPWIGFEAAAVAAVRKAFGLATDEEARAHCADVPGLASGNMYLGAMQLYGELHWERRYLAQAVRMLLEVEDANGLQVVLGLMRTGADNCHARKHYVFNAIIGRLKLPAASGPELTPASTAAAGESEAVVEARSAVSEVVTGLVEDMKDQAFKTTFLEPTKVFFRIQDDPVLEDQVDVHGANTYLALISATLGIEMSRRPHLDDIVFGVADFLTARMDRCVDLIWSEENLGQDWENLGELRQQLRMQREVSGAEGIGKVLGGIFLNPFKDVFIFRGSKPREVANAALDPMSPTDKRQALARYLEKFATFFSKHFILPRMISRITGEEGRPEALQLLKDDLVMRGLAPAGDLGEEDARFWLWDMSEVPARFNAERATLLLRHAGVLRG